MAADTLLIGKYAGYNTRAAVDGLADAPGDLDRRLAVPRS